MKEIKMRIIEAGHQAVEQLIKVAKEAIIKNDDEDELSADRLKNAAATKKLAIFDAFEILNRIEAEREALEMLDKGVNRTDTKQGFAERRSISNR
jgi:ASC-1-like (ASCH) protein